MGYKSIAMLIFSCFLWLEAHSKCFRVTGFSVGPICLVGKRVPIPAMMRILDSSGSPLEPCGLWISFSQHLQMDTGKQVTKTEHLTDNCLRMVAFLTKHIQIFFLSSGLW